ncbi:MAG: hypothetical protein AAF674_19450 [Pseudomonadota bacterium]
MRKTLAAAAVVLFALGSVSAYAAGCNYGSTAKQSTPPPAASS